jgi:hypothetical protein
MYPSSEVQLLLLQFILAFEVLSTRYRADNNLPRPNAPNAPAIVQIFFTYLYEDHDDVWSTKDFDVQS